MGILVCTKCKLPLEAATITVDYLGYRFDNEKVLRCPKCGLPAGNSPGGQIMVERHTFSLCPICLNEPSFNLTGYI